MKLGHEEYKSAASGRAWANVYAFFYRFMADVLGAGACVETLIVHIPEAFHSRAIWKESILER